MCFGEEKQNHKSQQFLSLDSSEKKENVIGS